MSLGSGTNTPTPSIHCLHPVRLCVRLYLGPSTHTLIPTRHCLHPVRPHTSISAPVLTHSHLQAIVYIQLYFCVFLHIFFNVKIDELSLNFSLCILYLLFSFSAPHWNCLHPVLSFITSTMNPQQGINLLSLLSPTHVQYSRESLASPSGMYEWERI